MPRLPGICSWPCCPTPGRVLRQLCLVLWGGAAAARRQLLEWLSLFDFLQPSLYASKALLCCTRQTPEPAHQASDFAGLPVLGAYSGESGADSGGFAPGPAPSSPGEPTDYEAALASAMREAAGCAAGT